MANPKTSNVGREIPETEKLGLEIESGAAAVFAPDSKPEQVETLVKLVNKRAHLTVQVSMAAVEKFNRRRQLVHPIQYKLRTMKRRISGRRFSEAS